MSTQHDHYEGLCALAASGQIAHDEFATLREHSLTCEECRHALADFRYVGAQVLSEYAEKRLFREKVPSEMTSRFVARARSEGIPLKYPEADQTTRIGFATFRLIAELVGAGLLLALTSPYVISHWKMRYRPERKAAVPSSLPNQASAVDHSAVIQPLQDLQAQLNESADQLASKAAALEAARSQVQRLEVRLTELEQTDVKLQQELASRDTQIADLTTQRDQLRMDIANLREAKSNQDLLFQANRSEVEDLRLRVASLSEELNQRTAELNERQDLTAAAEQAKDLIVARNLHIVDVHDNAAGNRPRPFGRVFYTEGKKLIFYAYDLGDNKASAKVTFYVWGEKSGTTEQARHLGILHADDRRDGRWVVTFDDPQVLAQINTVFVTAESAKKDPVKPSGNRILVAFLDGAPNHP